MSSYTRTMEQLERELLANLQVTVDSGDTVKSLYRSLNVQYDRLPDGRSVRCDYHNGAYRIKIAGRRATQLLRKFPETRGSRDRLFYNGQVQVLDEPRE